MSFKILADRYSVKEAVEEEKRIWLLSLLQTVGVEIDLFQEVDPGLFDDYLLSLEIEIIDYPSIGALMVKFQGEPIGEWGGADLELKIDSSGGYYFEVFIEEWSILDEEIYSGD